MGMKLGTLDWIFLHPPPQQDWPTVGMALGRLLVGFRSPKNWLGVSAELPNSPGGVEEHHPLLHLAVGDHPKLPGMAKFYPKLTLTAPRGASSVIHESLFLHYLILGRLLEM